MTVYDDTDKRKALIHSWSKAQQPQSKGRDTLNKIDRSFSGKTNSEAALPQKDSPETAAHRPRDRVEPGDK
jgi:hypothetical protein